MSPAEAAIREALDLILEAATHDEMLRAVGAYRKAVQMPSSAMQLLSELDALRARCEAGEALLREVRRDGGLHPGLSLALRTDAHLKGAGRE